MQDIAGARVVLEGGLAEQDRVAAAICDAFSGARLHDLRAAPHHGYRAVHIVVDLDELPVEVQVRTGLQHLWAQAFEMFADSAGRCLRYGLLPPESPRLREIKVVLALLDLLSHEVASAEAAGARGPEPDVSRLRFHLEMLIGLFAGDREVAG